MTTKQNTANTGIGAAKAPAYKVEHRLVLAITVIFGAISATAVLYHIVTAKGFGEDFTVIFAALGAAFAFGMAILPAALARPHGEAIEGASAQGSLTLVVIMVMIVDGSLQWHAISLIAEGLKMTLPNWWAMLLVIAAFQVSMFMSRGSLAASSAEQQEDLDAKAERLAQIEARRAAEVAAAEAHQEALALRREKDAARRAAARGDNVVNMR